MLSVLRFGSFALDLNRLALFGASGDQRELRPKSFEVLRYLVEHAGRVLSKEEIVNAVWRDVTVSDESLAQCVSDIRRAIDDESRAILKTIPRRGYLFEAQIQSVHAESAVADARSTSAAKSDSLPLPDRPSIAVLAFNNLTGDPQQEYFADGIVEDIITELSRFGELFVIARNSSFKYKHMAVDVRDVGRELGVHYVLEGSVRTVGQRVRIAAQLIDALNGRHRWAERYDRKLHDIFGVQDEVARTIVAITVAHIDKAEAERIVVKPPAAWEAYDFCMRASATLISYLSSLKRDDLFEVRHLAREAIAVDPRYARAHVLLSFTYLTAWYSRVDADYLTPAGLDRAYQSAVEAVHLDPQLPQAHAQLALVQTYRRDHDAAVASVDRASTLNPNLVDWRFTAALTFAGDVARAINVGHSYMRLDPFYPAFAAGYLGLSHYMAKDYAEASRLLRDCVSRSPNSRPAHGWLAATYAQSGQIEQARIHASEVLRIQPNWTIEGSAKPTDAFKFPHDAEHFLSGFRKAGLPLR